MASLTIDDNLTFTLEVLAELPHQGFINDGPVGMNSDLGLLRLLFQQTLGNEEWLTDEIVVFTDSLRSWIISVEEMILHGKGHMVTGFDNMACPHLLLNVQRREWSYTDSTGETAVQVTRANYEFFAGLSAAYLRDSDFWHSGPGFWLEPDGAELLAFVQALRQEVDATASETNGSV